MIHHVSLGTNDAARARGFYDPVLDLLGLRLIKTDETGVHYGTGDILFSLVVPTNARPASAGNGVHIALMARDRRMVDAFHELALRTADGAMAPPAFVANTMKTTMRRSCSIRTATRSRP